MNRAASAHLLGSLLGMMCTLCLDSFGAASSHAWVDTPEFRKKALQVAKEGKTGFTPMAPIVTGIQFTNELRGDAYLTNAVAHNGSGLAIGDIDGDDLPDIYLCGLQSANRLYRNLGDWKFAETDAGQAACTNQYSTGSAFADVDGDGDLDLLVNGIAAGTRLFLNDGRGQFSEVIDSGLSRTNSATSLALADIDGDGDLDLYCTHYIDVMHLADPTTRFAVARRDNKWEVTRINGESTRSAKWKDRFEALPDGSVRELPEVHGLYRNEGAGRFTPIQHDPGTFLNEKGETIPPFRDWGLAVMFHDINRDGAPDLYVCNDNASPDRLWFNTGKGTFRAADPLTLRHTSRSSMGLDFADVDRDGHDDLFVVDMLARDRRKRMMQLVRDYPDPGARDQIREQPRYNRNTLFFGRADGSFAEAALMAGVAASDWSWCPVFLDVDLDGYEDLLVSNGFSFDAMDQDGHDTFRRSKLTHEQMKRSRQLYPHWPTKNAAFHNRRDGTFEPVEEGWGINESGISYGMALGDLDADGDMDLVINNLNAAASVYRNDTSAPRTAIRLKGTGANTAGIGARVQLVGGSVVQATEMKSGGRYMSGDQSMRVFAGNAASSKSLRLEVLWRNGHQTTLSNLEPNHIYEVRQLPSRSNLAVNPGSATVKPIFEDATPLINHSHVDDPFDDSARQPLLPSRLSRLGPGLSWCDINGDGWEDLIVPSGRGGKLSVHLNRNGQSFESKESLEAGSIDQTQALGWTGPNNERKLLVALSNNEQNLPRESELIVVGADLRPPAAAPPPAGESSVGPMAMADIDADGDLDLFTGGRAVPGKYPSPASSSIWINDQGQLKRSSSSSEPFQMIGMVSAATFADLDGDGDSDLALAIEWGPVRVFKNDHGQFQDRTSELGLSRFTGWWSGIAAGDFDADGRLDLVVGNWGRNSEYELDHYEKLRAYYGDFNRDGSIEILEASSRGDDWFPTRNLNWLARAFPELKQQFSTHAAFADATVARLLGPQYSEARFVEAVVLESTLFLNRVSRFERVALPRQAQLAPVFAVNVGDFDADGKEDIFLGQNSFSRFSDLNRDDGGQGLCLRGDGNGAFTVLNSNESGIRIDGEQRGAALADFNHDGRVDLAVAQNNAATKLYLNRHPVRGLRVSFKGGAHNPAAIGAQMRVVYSNNTRGPLRTIQAGSGYWSQDASTQVLGLSEGAQSLWVRSPAGKEQIIPTNQRDEIQIDFQTQN